jgi:CheY-like chemotaxis protein
MLHGSASDEATVGTYLRMGQLETTDAVRRQLQLLLVGGSEEEFASLHELLVGTSNGPLHLERAALPEDVLNRLGKEDYDHLLSSIQSTDNVAFQVLRQVRQHVSGVPLIFLSDRVNKDVSRFPFKLSLVTMQPRASVGTLTQPMPAPLVRTPRDASMWSPRKPWGNFGGRWNKCRTL